LQQIQKNTSPNKDRELDEFTAHLFLERKGEPLTVAALRLHLNEIDLDKNRNVSFIEYIIWKYKKTLDDMFKVAPGASAEMLAQLDQAISNFQEVLSVRRAREAKMAELERVAALGGVKGMAAKNQIDQMRQEDLLAQNKREVTSEAKKLKAQKIVERENRKGEEEARAREKALQEETKRLEAERIAKEEADRKAKEDSKTRLKAKAALWK